MGLVTWLRQRGKREPDRPAVALQQQPTERRVISLSIGYSACVEVAGTTTFAKDAVEDLAARKGLGERGYYQGTAQLQREPENPVNPHAVSVTVNGERVGCLPSYASEDVHLPVGASQPVHYQLHILREEKLLAKAYVWLGDGEPEWAYIRENPPALTAGERINSAHAEKSAMVREALEGGGARAAQFRRGMVDGVHYLELVEPIKQLKREGRFEEALVLCYKAIEGAEGDADDSIPAPGYTEQAAIVHRKLRTKRRKDAIGEQWCRRWVHTT